MTEWVPPAMDEHDFQLLTATEDGLPEYLRPQVVEWILDVAGSQGELWKVFEFLSLNLKKQFTNRGVSDLRNQLSAGDDSQLLNIADCLLFHNIGYAYPESGRLKGILDVGRSEWTVVEMSPGVPRVARRVPTGVILSYSEVASSTAIAGKLLAEAFESAYGSDLNPNHSYDLSVKAVETLACPKYLPRDSGATLGKVISHLGNKSISLPLREYRNANHKTLILQMMQTLWEGCDRHGSGNYAHISLEGARTAQALAFSLVAMIHEDVISVS